MKNDDEKPRDSARVAHVERTAGWRERGAFTEVFLAQISKPEDSQAARRFGRLLDSAILECDRGDPASEHYLSLELRAVLADLRRLEYELAGIGRLPEDCEIEAPRDLALCRLAAKKAFAVARIADAIEKAIGPAPRRGNGRTNARRR